MARSDWTFGEFVGSRDWLTVLGSYYVRPVLHSTAEEADEGDAGASRVQQSAPSLEVAHVEERGRYYKVTPTS